jgi:hypothetical protein
MAEYTTASCRLNIRLQVGTNDQGRPVLRSLSMRNVSPSALADDVDSVSTALGSLLEFPVVETSKIDTNVVA